MFIRAVCFFPPDESAPPPPDSAANIVHGKGYDLGREPAATYFGNLPQRMPGHTVDIDLAGPWTRRGPVFGDPRLGRHRLGRHAFKARMQVAYERRCAITGSKIRPVLQAAHVRPVTEGGEQFYEHAGYPIALPPCRAGWSGGEFLEWHLDTIFKAS